MVNDRIMHKTCEYAKNTYIGQRGRWFSSRDPGGRCRVGKLRGPGDMERRSGLVHVLASLILQFPCLIYRTF